MDRQDSEVVIRSLQEEDIPALLRSFAEQGWTKPQQVLEGYLLGQSRGELAVLTAEFQKQAAGYAVLYPHARHGPFAEQKLPEISDFIVFIKFQHRGIGGKILDAAEKQAARLCDRVSLGVGLHAGYGTAQRLYIKRGYVPDGSGVWYRDKPLPQYADCRNDDDLVLYLSKQL